MNRNINYYIVKVFLKLKSTKKKNQRKALSDWHIKKHIIKMWTENIYSSSWWENINRPVKDGLHMSDPISLTLHPCESQNTPFNGRWCTRIRGISTSSSSQENLNQIFFFSCFFLLAATLITLGFLYFLCFLLGFGLDMMWRL